MKQYAFIYGDDTTKADPLVVVFDDGKYEFICESFRRQSDWYEYVKQHEDMSFDDFLRRFTYMNVERGDISNEVQSRLNKLRAKYVIEHLAQQEQEKQQREPKKTDTERALLEISKRMRTGINERG